MATHTTDFWPDDLGLGELRTPVALLREQATALGEKTKNVVTAEVDSDNTGKFFIHKLYLVAPALHYRYQLLTIQHPILFYPMDVTTPTSPWATVKSEAEFAEWLKTVLASEGTKKVIRSLIAQSQGQ
jgi:hypothetical protein